VSKNREVVDPGLWLFLALLQTGDMKVLTLIKENRGYWTSLLSYALALREEGIDSRALLFRGDYQSPWVTEVRLKSNRLERKTFRELDHLADLVGLSHFPNLANVKLIKLLKEMEFDILHISSARMVSSYLTFPWLTRIKPTIFSVTSMWAFTGHCHFAFGCSRWKTGCGECPHLNIPPSIKRDATHMEWKMKNLAYSHSNFHVVADSNWLAEQVKESMLNRFPLDPFFEAVDTKIYRPLDKKRCRLELGIPLDKKVLMFASVSLNEFRKGGDLLINALKGLPQSMKRGIALLCIGQGSVDISETLGIEVLNLGYVGDHQRKAICYSAADLFLFPTRADTFGIVSIESQACGTPVVSFDVGGVSQHVRPGITGYLAESGSVEDFRKGIIELIENQALRDSMSQKCHAVVEKEFSLELYAQRFGQLCRSLITKGA
jgi:glycosyltransferase involved in cell wall biosynthesis